MSWIATALIHPDAEPSRQTPGGGRQSWDTLPLSAQLYVAAVIAGGAAVLAMVFPRTFPQPLLFVGLLVFACLTSAWKVNLPIPIANGSTLSVSYAANLMSLLLMGPGHAVVIAMAGVWTQCTYKAKHSDPVYRAIFSMAAVVLTMAAAGLVYGWLGGRLSPESLGELARPVVGTVGTYFLVNTGLVAGAIALSTNRSLVRLWKEDFLWSGASFMVAGAAGALSAVVVARSDHWQAALLLAPIYLTYRTYELFVGRLDDQTRHAEEMRRLHQETVAALGQARAAERALAAEKERLAATLAEMTRLEQQRQHALEREQQARATAESANRLKDQFLAMVSHELRTPLNAIVGWADMLRRGTLAADVRDLAAHTIFQSAKRQSQLIDDLLDVSRIVSGKLRLNRTHLDMVSVLRDAAAVVQPGADGKRIRLTVDAVPPIPPVYGDGARLQQVMWNLLSNAVKFTPEGGAVHASLRNAPDREAIEIVVNDTGVGIPREFLPSVFDAFRQADPSSTRVHPGLGLGLSIAKSLVDAHGGTVSASSEGEGRGATFTVMLPAAGASDRVADLPSETDGDDPFGTVSPALEGVRVLVVDDDAESRQIVAAHLEEGKACVLTAVSAAEALDMLERQPIDVLVSDIAMPDQDGYSLIRTIRHSPAGEVASMPAAALTAFARDEDRREALQAGFQMHLVKPIDAQALIAAVSALRSRRV